ncbi:MAG: tetratricopeptide repeat protein [Bacteroidetes bacterium]|nr:tetratricopeptide repeat protein [Bacteroidota bacterium]
MHPIRLQKLLDFLKNEPEDPFLKYAIATEYFSIKDYKNALFYFEDLIKNHPDYVGTYYHLGKLYEIIGRKTDAIEIYRNGMNFARKNKDMHAFSELQSVLNSASGLDYEDD